MIVRVYTRTGDDGTTGLLYGGRIGKDSLRVEAYGATDEAVAALGLGRAQTSGALAETLLRLQRELFVVGAELATAPDNARKLDPSKGTKVTDAMVVALETLIDDATASSEQPREFVIPGNTVCSAAIDLARAIVRRAERRVTSLVAAGEVDGVVARYLNRLADALFVLARVEEGSFTPLHER
jgi:cob(I)alamin adenosyltransferase